MCMCVSVYTLAAEQTVFGWPIVKRACIDMCVYVCKNIYSSIVANITRPDSRAARTTDSVAQVCQSKSSDYDYDLCRYLQRRAGE